MHSTRKLLQVAVTLLHLLYRVEICCSFCDHVYYDKVQDCSKHPLRIGFYPFPGCGELHTLTDAQGKPNANYARLNHPAAFVSGSGTKYMEYSAGTYLSIKFAKQVHVHGIAMQGSPKNLRYYLRSFELWYKTTLYDTNLNSPASTIQGFYKENGITKRFEGEMQNTTKFILANPIYAEELRIYPVLFSGAKVFRMEVFGCYLGRISVPRPEFIGVGNEITIILSGIQNANSSRAQHYFKINEPDGNSSLVSFNKSANYTFKSGGQGNVELGLQYESGWLKADEVIFVVQGPILDLQMLLDGSTDVPFRKTEGLDIEFRLTTTNQPYQLKKFLFRFGDSTTCSHNYCKKKYSNGMYNVIGVASNDFFSQALTNWIIACPSSTTPVTYVPAVYQAGIGVTYLGPAVTHNVTVRLYSLWVTTYDAWLGGNKIQTGSFNSSGLTSLEISLPTSIVAPSQPSFPFNYTDSCGANSYTATIYVDEKVEGLSLRITQPFKSNLIEQVPYFFLNQLLSIHIDVENGTSILCQVSISRTLGSFSWYTANAATAKSFMYNYTFVPPNVSPPLVGGRCWNRLNHPTVTLSPTPVDLREIPEEISGFSLQLSNGIVRTTQSFYLYVIFRTGNDINCSISSVSAAISRNYVYQELVTFQQVFGESRKAYRLPFSIASFSMGHRIDVVCRNLLKEVKGNVTIQVQIPVSGLSITSVNFVCFGSNLIVNSSLTQGAPIRKSLFVNSIKKLDYVSTNITSNSFSVTPIMYGVPGWKSIYVTASNDVSSLTSATKIVRIALIIELLDVQMSFTLTSPQALTSRPQFVLPTSKTINFAALISPNKNGYIFRWSINGAVTQTTTKNWQYTFSSAGVHNFRLVADGCNNVVYEKNVTLVAPIQSFVVSFSPTPAVVVNKTAKVLIAFARNSECLELDFGDGSPALFHCSTSNSLSVLKDCFIVNSVCEVYHTYRERGSFVVRVNASNGLYARAEETMLVAKTCYNPEVIVQGSGIDVTDFIANNTSPSNVAKLKRSVSLHYNITSIVPDCEFSNSYSHSWKVYSADVGSNSDGISMLNNSSLLLSNSEFNFSRNSLELSIPCCLVKYGLLAVVAEVNMTGDSNAIGFSTQKVFFVNIIQTDLVASLEGPSHVIFPYDVVVTLDGSKSFDPDKYTTDFKYYLYCRDTVLETRHLSLISYIPTVNSSYYNSSENVIGCFGHPVAQIESNSSESSIAFNSKNVQQNHTLEINLFIKGINPYGIRNSNTSKTLLVLTKETPYFTISCSSNCARKMNPSSKLSLTVTCTIEACQNNPVFKWTLTKRNNNDDFSVALETLLASKDSDKDLEMKANSLEPGRHYTLRLKGTGVGGASFEQQYSFETNIAPANGSCIVFPQQGVSRFTSLRVSCSGWSDIDLPLSYEVYTVTDVKTFVLCAQSYHSSCQSWLPVGYHDERSFDIKVKITDSLNMNTQLKFGVENKKSLCDSELYDPVTDCANHPLAIGNYGNPNCGSLHMLTDSDGKPHADYARLNHPATYSTGSGTQYYEYVAGEYLSIKLSKQAKIHAIAMQGSANSSRYYLKSFKLWYKSKIYSFNPAQSSTIVQEYYKEGGIVKLFQDDMQNVTKFTLANPFFAEEIRVYPITAHIKKAFRFELYGCYLGRVSISMPVGVGNIATITSQSVQDVNDVNETYYFKANEPDGSEFIHNISSSATYTFKSRGLGSLELGIKYSTGWLITDRIDFIVYGQILGLKLLLNGKSSTPYKATENKDIRFQLRTNNQPYQMTRFLFSFGDSSTCNQNNCMKKYPRGIYTATGTALNDYYHTTLQVKIISCPSSAVNVSYQPEMHLGGIGITYLGPTAVHNFTIRFYALWTTTFNVLLDGLSIKNGTIVGNGWTEQQIFLPSGLVAPSQPSLTFSYTDACESRSYATSIFVDEEVAGISLRLNQTYKDQFIELVPYFINNKLITINLDVSNGTSIQCELSIRLSSNSSTVWHATNAVDVNTFAYNHVFNTSGDSIVMIGGKCWNRLNLPDVVLAPIAVEIFDVPIALKNLTLAVNKLSFKTNEPMNLSLILLAGNKINCNVSYNGTDIMFSFDYRQLEQLKEPRNDSKKAYRLTLPSNSLTSTLLINVTCRNVWNELKNSITVSVSPVPITGITLGQESFGCFDATTFIHYSILQGSPIYSSLFIDAVKQGESLSFNGVNSSFAVTRNLWVTPGWKQVNIQAWNQASSVSSIPKTMRVAETIVSLNVVMNFTLSSLQALSDRPNLVLPITETINFMAVVSPNVSGYLYNWTINETSASTLIPNWSYTFLSTGIYRLNLVVDGCNNVVYGRYLTVISPVDDFTVTSSPNSEVVVNKTTLIQISNARHSDCLKLDFGDGSSPMMHCKTYNTHSDLNCFSENSVCQVSHIYRSRGNFTVKVTATNGLYKLSKEMRLAAKICQSPIFTLEGDGIEITDINFGRTVSLIRPIKPRSSSLHYDIARVTVNCEFSESYDVTWSIYSPGTRRSLDGSLWNSTDWNNSTYLVGNETFQFSRSNQTVLIPCCIVNYGALFISARVSMTGHINTAGIFTDRVLSTFISQTDLVASMKVKGYRIYQYNTTINIDASSSRDPDAFSTDLNYTLYCRDTVLETRSIADIPNIPAMKNNQPQISALPLASPTNASAPNMQVLQEVIGCFGQPVAKINVDRTTKIFSFNSAEVQENHTLEFTLVLEGRNPFGVRRSKTSRTLLVPKRDTPFFIIRCTENCAKKIDSSIKFSLVVDCMGGACSSHTAVFKWRMDEHSPSSSITIPLEQMLYSRDTDKNLYMKPNVLKPGRNYTLQLVATAPDGSDYKQTFSFQANNPPINGSCVVDPNKGVAIYSKFFINCTGWIDTELPLLYEVAHVTELLTTVVCRQHDNSCQTIFPIGENVNSTLRIRVRIFDSMKMFTETFYTIQVEKPTSDIKQLTDLLTRINNTDTNQDAAQLIGAVASLLNANINEIKSQELLALHVELRDSSMRKLSTMVNTSSDDVIAPLIAMVAMVPQEFTQVSGNLATQASITMTDDLVRSHANAIFRDLISRSKSLLAAMGMVMKSTSVNLDPNRNVKNESNVTENPLKWITEEGRLIVLNSSVSVDSLVNTVFSRMSPVETPLDILTINLGVNLVRKNRNLMNTTTKHSVMNGMVVLPSTEDLRIDQRSVINSMMKVSSFNSFFWGPKSKLINSSLIEYSIKSNEEVLSVTNTKQKIQLFVPRDLSHQLPYQHWLFQERANSERVNFHKLKIENGNSIHIEFKPMNYCSSYSIYIKHGSRPSRDNYDRNWTIPNLSLCNSTGLQDVVKLNICETYKELVPSLLTYGDNETTPNLNCTLKDFLERRIKEITSICTLDPYRLFMLDTETKDGTYYIGIYDMGNSASMNSSAAEMLNDTRKCQVADNLGETSYYIRSYTTKCRYWDGSKENWLDYGCQVGEMTNASLVHCNCNHLTSFASDFFIAPNPIDIDKVIAGFKNIGDNLSVLVTLCLLSGLYIYLIVVVRKSDRKDQSKVSVVVIDDDPLKAYEYLVITVTGARAGAGTTANVFCSLNNETQIGEPRLLYDPEKRSFQRDQINAFKIAFEKPIDDITDIRIWHDNKGESPGWYLSRVYVEEMQTNQRYSFICEQWLATELEDGLIDRTIPVAGSEDQKTFSHIFTTKTAKDFSDQHLWLSIVLKRPHDSFTRVQRVTACMVVLCTTMLTSAMFFQLDNDSKYLWKIGSLTINFKGIIIGIQSAFIILPINGAIVELFRNSESFSNYKKRKETKSLDGGIPKRTKFLPCGFIFVAWLLSVLAIISSMVVILFYSMQWGNERSQQFVISVFTGFCQSAFVIQPFKLVAVAVILASVFKKQKEENDVLDMYKYSSNRITVDPVQHKIFAAKLQPKPLTKEQLVYARKRRLMEVRLRLFLQDLISYLIFLLFLGFVVRGYRDPDAYQFSKALQDDVIHKHFQHLQDIPGLWGWVQNHFIPAVYSQTWYNGENFTNFKMLRNQEAFRIGLSRIRQLRIKPGTCKLDEDVVGIVNSCNDFYRLDLNEERDFNVAWKPLVAARKRRSLSNDAFKFTQRSAFDTNEEALNSMKANILPIDLALNLKAYDIGTDAGIGYETHSTHGLGTGQYFLKKGYENEAVDRTEGPDLEEDDEIHRRSKRAIKFKVRRKTIPSASTLKHSNDIIIDSQYLLPDGRVRPNKDHWKYNQASKLRGFPYYGKFALYSGGGYVASLATDIDYARAVAVALEQDSWVDTLTRAVFFEFSVYNANLNFFATGFIMVEVLPTGNIIPSQSIRVFKLYRYVGTFGRLVMASEIILVVALLFFIYKECRHMYRIGSAYFKQFWSWVEITIAVALFAAMILRGFSWYEGDKILTELTKDPNKYINFHYAVLADDALLVAITIICFASTLKILKIISVFPTVVALKETLRLAAKPLVNFALPFTILFCAFAILGHLLFMPSDMFHTYVRTGETQMLMLVGGSVYNTLVEANETFGQIFFLMFALFETFVFMNMFVAILNESISESKQENQSTEFAQYAEERTLVALQTFSSALKRAIDRDNRIMPKDQVSTEVEVKLPKDQESTEVKVKLPKDQESTEVKVKLPKDHESTEVKEKLPKDQESTEVEVKLPKDQESTEVEVKLPKDHESKDVKIKLKGSCNESSGEKQRCNSIEENVKLHNEMNLNLEKFYSSLLHLEKQVVDNIQDDEDDYAFLLKMVRVLEIKNGSESKLFT